ncbi:MAG: AAA family ATPase [Anaerolineae bacterium]|nr:AAA family ATPase [Anaerolineae bacterium]
MSFLHLDHPAEPTLIGREKEFSMLQEYYAATLKGRAPMVLVEGEAGLGKTRLLRSFAAWARQQGAWVVYMSCREAEVGIPYSALVRAVRALANDPSIDLLPLLTSTLQAQPWFPILLRLVPELAWGLGVAPTNEWPRGFLTPGQVHKGAVELLEAVTRTTPVVWITDDLHWTDTATLELQAAVYRRLRSRPLLMVKGYRPEEVDQAHPLHRLRTMLLRMNGLQRVRLQPLETDHVRQLVTSLAPGLAIGDEVSEQPWSGNPAYWVALARLHTEGQRLSHMPLGLREAHELLLARMPVHVRSVLEAAAVLDTAADSDLLAEVAGLPSDQVNQALRWLVSHGDMEWDGGGYVVVNVSLERAAYERMEEDRRRDLHLRAGRALEARHKDLPDAVAAMLARHYEAADQPEQVLRHAMLAGSWARRLFALEEAQELYWNALSYAVLLGEAQAQTTIHEALGIIRAERGHHRAALEHFHAALGGIQTASRQALVGVHMARSLGAIGEYERAKDALQSALQQVASQKTPYLDGVIWLHMAWVEERLGDRAAALKAADRALRAAKEAEDQLLEADVAAQFALLRWHQGDLESAWSLYQTSLRIREQVGDLVGIARVWDHLGQIESDRGRLQSARHCFSMSAQAYHRAGEWLAEAVVRARWGEVAATAYALAESVEQFRQAFSLYHEFQDMEGSLEIPLWTRLQFD